MMVLSREEFLAFLGDVRRSRSFHSELTCANHDAAQRERIAELEQSVANWRAAAGAMPVDQMLQK